MLPEIGSVERIDAAAFNRYGGGFESQALAPPIKSGDERNTDERQADHHEPIACLDQSKKAEDRPQNCGDGGKRFERQWHGWNKAGTGRYRLPLRLRGYFVVGGIGPPPPPMVRAFIVRPPFRFLGNLRSLTRSVYYGNTVYVNSVDTNRSCLEHSWSGQYPSSFASSAWATYSGVAFSGGIFPGILRRQVRRTSNIHGHDRARRKQCELSKHRQSSRDAGRVTLGALRRSGECHLETQACGARIAAHKKGLEQMKIS